MSGKHYDLVLNTKKYKGESHEFFLDMKSWKRFKTRYNLNWTKVPFSAASKSLVPDAPGIYIFTAELLDSKLPAHGYILYVGITGDGASASNLRIRYSQYMNQLNNQNGRPAVFYMLENWRDELMFNFVPFTNKAVDLAKLEHALINSLWPPINRRDFEAEKAAVRQAAF